MSWSCLKTCFAAHCYPYIITVELYFTTCIFFTQAMLLGVILLRCHSKAGWGVPWLQNPWAGLIWETQIDCPDQGVTRETFLQHYKFQGLGGSSLQTRNKYTGFVGPNPPNVMYIYWFGGAKFTKRYVYNGLVGPTPPNAMYITVWRAQIHQTLCI